MRLTRLKLRLNLKLLTRINSQINKLFLINFIILHIMRVFNDIIINVYLQSDH